MLPPLPYGTETNQMRFPLAMNLNPSTVARVITDLVRSLETHGVRKCVLLNGHGGNDLKWVLRELHSETKVHLFLCNWYKVAADQYPTIFDDAGDHAGRDGDEHGPGPLPRPRGDGPGRPGRDGPDPVRGRQPRLGRDHPPLAPPDDQLRRGRPPAGHRRARASGRPSSSSNGSRRSSPSFPPARPTRPSLTD